MYAELNSITAVPRKELANWNSMQAVAAVLYGPAYTSDRKIVLLQLNASRCFSFTPYTLSRKWQLRNG